MTESTLLWNQTDKYFGLTEDEWKTQDTWFHGTFSRANITIRTHHDKTNSKYYFNIKCESEHNDLLLDDTHVIHNRKEFSDIQDEVNFYEYLRSLLAITVSDINLMIDAIYVAGPSGIINCKGNLDKNEAEKYYEKNKDEYYQTDYMKFFDMVNKLLKMDEIIDNVIDDSSDNEDAFTMIPFMTDKHLPSTFGGERVMPIIRRGKNLKLDFDVSTLKGKRFNHTSIYQPCDKTINDFHLNPSRRIFLFKSMLDFYLKYGEDKTLESFKYEQVIKQVSVNDETNGIYLIES